MLAAYQYQAIHDAAVIGDVSQIEALLQSGVRIDARSKDLRQPIHMAVRAGHLHVVAALLERLASATSQDRRGDQPIHIAAMHGHVSVMGLLLERHCAIDARNDAGDQPIHHAARRGYYDAVHFCLQQGAKVAARSDSGDQPIHAAAGGGHRSILELLLASGAKVTARNIRGEEPILGALSRGYRDVVTCLLDRGALCHEHDLITEVIQGPVKREMIQFVWQMREASRILAFAEQQYASGLHEAALQNFHKASVLFMELEVTWKAIIAMRGASQCEEALKSWKSCIATCQDILALRPEKGVADEIRQRLEHARREFGGAPARLPSDTEEWLYRVFMECTESWQDWGDGQISLSELLASCRSKPTIAAFFGLTPSACKGSAGEEAVKAIFKEIDANGNDRISFNEFRDYYSETSKERIMADRLCGLCGQPVKVDSKTGETIDYWCQVCVPLMRAQGFSTSPAERTVPDAVLDRWKQLCLTFLARVSVYSPETYRIRRSILQKLPPAFEPTSPAAEPEPEDGEDADSETSWETDPEEDGKGRKGWELGPIGGRWHKEGDVDIYTIQGTTVTAEKTGSKIELTGDGDGKAYSGSINGKEVKAKLAEDGRLKWESKKMGVWFREELDGVWRKDGAKAKDGKEVLYEINGHTLTNLKTMKEYELEPQGDGKCSWLFESKAFQGQISIIGKLRWSNDSVWIRVEGPWPRLRVDPAAPREKKWRKKPKKEKKTKVESGEKEPKGALAADENEQPGTAATRKKSPERSREKEQESANATANLVRLAVTIVSARKLRNADATGASDPFCACEVAREDGGDPKYAFQTPTLQNTSHPKWNHKHIIPAYHPEDPLEFYVWDHDEEVPDLLGSLMLMPSEFYPNGLKGEFRLEEEDGNVGEATIQLAIEVLPPPTPATPEPEPKPDSPTPADLMHRTIPEQPWSWSPGGVGARWDLESLRSRSDARDTAWRAGLQTVWRPVPVTPFHQDCRRELEHENEALRIRLAELEWRLQHDQAQNVAQFSQFREFQQFEHFKRWQQSLEQPIRLR